MKKTLCIYHHPCTDGWVAALSVGWGLGFENVDYHPAQYGETPPDVTGRDVVIVDFSYPREQLEAMHDQADSLLVLDHHKSAQKDLEGLSYAHFDMDKSGAVLAWEHFNEGEVPFLHRYVQDRDLWEWKMPGSKAVSNVLFTLPLGEIKPWTDMHSRLSIFDRRDMVFAQGEAIEAFKQTLVENAVDNARLVHLRGEDALVPMTICSPEIRSEVGNVMLQDSLVPYSVTMRETNNGFIYSLRSMEGRADVSEICTAMKGRGAKSGGGHRDAAGFVSTFPMHTWAKVE